MIYLIHPNDGRMMVCESEQAAKRAEVQGFVRVPYAAYHAAWQEVDRKRRLELGKS